MQAEGNAGKFADDIAEIYDHQRKHHQECWADAELLADQIAQAFTGGRAHSRRHLLDDNQRDGDRDHRPQQRVAELRSCLRVSGDAVGVVIYIGGNETGTDD